MTSGPLLPRLNTEIHVDIFLQVAATGLFLGGIYALVSVGLNLIFGVIRVVNFAHGELVMLGMYGAYVVVTIWQWDLYVAAVVVTPILFLIGVLMQRLVIQPLQDEPMMQIFATFGLVILIQNIMLGTTRGIASSVRTPASEVVFRIGPTSLTLTRIVVLVSAVLVTVALQIFLRRTMPGKAIRAVTQDRRAARLMGINVERVYMATFGLGAALAGLGGVLIAPLFTITPFVGFPFAIAAFAVVVLGGLGSVPGAFFGGLIVGLVEAFAGFYIDPALKQAIWFLVFVAVLVVRPSGLLGQKGAEEMGLT